LNPPYALTGSKRRILALTIALAACLAAVSLCSAQALAGSGGTGPDGADDGAKASSEPTANTSKYNRLWDRTSQRQKRWASRTAECESGKDPNAIGGGGRYRGAFQFMKSTWRTSPKSPGGDPIDYSYKTQAVVAVALKKRDGAGHWPVCG
jgi:hypothetical protein